MGQVIVRYKVKPESAEENETLVRRVYEELHQTAPAGLHYATFVHDDGVSFVHIASTDSDTDESPLMKIAAFRDFQKDISDRCVDPPSPAPVREIGSYRFWSRQEGT